MFDLGTQELIVIFIVAFLVFGPKKLPELGRTLGKGIRELKNAMRNVKDSIDEAVPDVTEEIKEVKTGLHDSIYQSIEKNQKDRDDAKDIKDKKETRADNESGSESREGGKVKKETDQNG
ncbi:MAG: twin-arginine translocase TatA/TatE family subunit [Nitrospiraceae bacterium]|nr:MAG: twin-arginine translocase TatA/TatE family subunit [Nitrospiraceae bacterium]